MNIIKNWFNNDGHLEMIVSDGEYIHRIIKHDSESELPKDIEVGINLSHSNHYITPKVVHKEKGLTTYLLSYYNGINQFDASQEFIYNEEMLEAHKDAEKSGLKPIFGYEDVTTNEKDEIVVVNVKKFK